MWNSFPLRTEEVRDYRSNTDSVYTITAYFVAFHFSTNDATI